MPVSEPSKIVTPEALDTGAFAGFKCPSKSTHKLYLTTALTTDSEIFRNRKSKYPGVAQLVARVVWDHQAAGSNPVTRTIGETVGICRRSFAMPAFMRVCYLESLESPIITLESKIE